MDGPPKLVVEKYLQFMYEGDNKFEEPILKSDAASCRDINTLGFTPTGNDIRQFGNRRVTIEAVRLISQGSNIGIAYSGQMCEIGMVLQAHEDVANPIVGFIVRDRLGREILGDNTDLMNKKIPSLSRGLRYAMAFQMDAWPNLAEGEYTLTIAVADGALENHLQCHFLYDVLIFKSVPSRTPYGLLSVPNTTMTFSLEGH